ncbi:MAG: radical SAM protein [Candidatus Lokiarchaeota archaeon]|nr:radical SAM protein [Candidatus Lokiarchaeota archaeon]MBD3200967.1 radical SAM protein [Candidatus Lokiarchaeota archaeon]
MKIGLINPNITTSVYTPWIPLGILYIGTILKDNGFRVEILDAAAKRFTNEDTMNWIKEIKPDIIGISCLTISFLPTIELVKLIKNYNPLITVVLGHYHPTMVSERIIQKYGQYIDYCIRGEGEYVFLKLCEFLDNRDDKYPLDLKGLTFRGRNNKIIKTPDAPLIYDLDEIPFPDRKLIDFDYKWSFSGIEFSNSNLTSVVSSRGCPFSCTYCACSNFAKHRFRPRSSENIVEELLYLEEQGYEQITFVDDNFTLQPKRTIKVCELIKKEKIDISWHTDSRVDRLSQNMLTWMKKSGCKSLWFGFESANQRILDLYQKNTKVSQFDTAIKKSRKANIELIIGLFMLGGPTETLEEVKNTINYAIRSDIDLPFFNVVEIWPGIQMWDEYISQGLINPSDVVLAQVNDIKKPVERWETTTRVLDLSDSSREKYEILNEIQSAYERFFSLNRLNTLLKTSLRVLRSKFMLKMALSIFGNLKDAIDAISTFRSSKVKGFGMYEE